MSVQWEEPSAAGPAEANRSKPKRPVARPVPGSVEAVYSRSVAMTYWTAPRKWLPRGPPKFDSRRIRVDMARSKVDSTSVLSCGFGLEADLKERRHARAESARQIRFPVERRRATASGDASDFASIAIVVIAHLGCPQHTGRGRDESEVYDGLLYRPLAVAAMKRLSQQPHRQQGTIGIVALYYKTTLLMRSVRISSRVFDLEKYRCSRLHTPRAPIIVRSNDSEAAFDSIGI